ncbi:MAG: thrombospondin type 3 repeat-containing protein [Phycisphaerales bacterium]
MKTQFNVAAAVTLVVASAAQAQQSTQWRTVDAGNGHWYVVTDQYFQTWTEARDYAESMGGHLATMTSAAEQAFVRALVMAVAPAWEGECWLGAWQDASAPEFAEPSAGWRWVTGEPWSFTAWMPDRPDNAQSGSDFLAAGSNAASQFRWFDRTGVGFARAVIEWSRDCHADGLVDHGQVRAGALADVNRDGVPDLCQDLSADIRVPADYPTIQQAIDAAAAGDIIEVAAGIFGVTSPLDARGKAFTLRGTLGAEGVPATIVDGAETSRLLDCVLGEGPRTRFENICFQRGFGLQRQPVWILHSSPTFVRCLVRDSRTPVEGTVGIYGGCPVFMDCRIIDNSAGAGGAVAVAYTNPQFRGCTFSGNRADGYGGAFYCSVNGRVSLDGCLVNANTAGISDGGFRFAMAGSGFFRNTRVCGNLPDNGGVADDGGLNCYAGSCTACTGDADGDGVPNESDNCPLVPNPAQVDCNANGVGDACDPLGTDCDQNGQFDTCQISAGASDINRNWVLDSCECIADLFVDGAVNGVDLGVLLAYWGPTTSAPPSQRSDMNRDGAVDGVDLGYLLSRWGACGN